MTGYPQRNSYVANRSLTRMQGRGEPMTLRRISMLDGPEAFKNPPDLSDDLTVVAANEIDGQAYFNIAGSTILGRLVPGDLITTAGNGQHRTTWRVVTMPVTVSTDSDGIPQVDGSGAPTFGSTLVYNTDSLAWDNVLPVVPVEFVHGPIIANVPATWSVSGSSLTLAPGLWDAAGFVLNDDLRLTGVPPPDDALNGVFLFVHAGSDPTLALYGHPDGLVDASFSSITITIEPAGDPDITLCIGQTVATSFAADLPIFGNQLTSYQMTAMGWTEVDGIGLNLAAKGIDPPPKVNDVILLVSDGNDKRSIVQLGRRSSNGVNFLFPVQVK